MSALARGTQTEKKPLRTMTDPDPNPPAAQTYKRLVRKQRLQRKLAGVIDLMVFEGRKRADAAKALNMHDDSVRKALKRPDVLEYLNTQMKVLRDSARSRTIFKAEELMDTAESERVRLAAIEFLNPNEAASKVTHVHEGTTPGLTIVFEAGSAEPKSINSTAGAVIEAKPGRKLTPHPAMIEAESE